MKIKCSWGYDLKEKAKVPKTSGRGRLHLMYMPYHVHCLSEIAVSSECWTMTKQSHCILSTITYLASLFIISCGFAKRTHDNNGFYKITYRSAMAILKASHDGLTESEVTRQYWYWVVKLVVMMQGHHWICRQDTSLSWQPSQQAVKTISANWG